MGSGASIAIPPPSPGISEQLEFFGASRCTHFSATPSFWRRVLMNPAADRLDPKQITLGGEIADDPTLAAIAQRWPTARLVHIFASTETGTLFTVTDRRAGFPVEFLQQPPGSVELAVSEHGTLLARPTLSDSPPHPEFVDTGDRVEVRDGRVLFLGRLNGVVNVGGNKVSPEEVEGVILEVPGVVAVLVHGIPSPLLGSAVVAEVIQDPDLPTDAARTLAIRKYCSERLDRFKVPSNIEFVAALRQTASGKLERG
jgi:acyl-CoA synthetase (AMP-forming)/AMP-acid ligase II